MKLKQKTREGGHVQRHYDTAQTPFQRLLAAEAVATEQQTRLTRLFEGLDPVRLLRQLDRLQDALWQLAVLPTSGPSAQPSVPTPVRFVSAAAGLDEMGCVPNADEEATPAASNAAARQKRKYRRTKSDPVPHTWRTRPDPFAEVITEVEQRLEANPELTAKQLFSALQAEHPGQFPDVQLRTFQRRVAEWRANAILTFQDQWLAEDQLQAPPTLRGQVDYATPVEGQASARAADEAPATQC